MLRMFRLFMMDQCIEAILSKMVIQQKCMLAEKKVEFQQAKSLKNTHQQQKQQK